ncbi:MAG: sulfite exporter TauE/SafE family protein [Myxococcales bacterium]|nr:sulfite exporter TauE/SafE family protein [Myxococcales bacterium]MCB9630168.1 sulfite exporter TauE/SafE family protein [Sandaracinaceae bacterium]
MTWASYDVGLLALMTLAGLVAGFVNTLAGGGSLLTVPALMALGLPADVANASNRVAVLSQAATGSYRFHREGKLDTRAIRDIAAPTLVGAVLGALAASYFPVRYLKPVLLLTMGTMAVVMVVRPAAIAPEGAVPKRATDHPRAMLGLFAAGLYGGFVQAGVGFVLLMVLAGTLHYDLVRANALKMLCTLGFGAASLAVFIARDQVAWAPALVLAVATSLGSVLGVKYAVKADPKQLKRFVAALVVLACLGVAAQELWGG